MIPILLALVLQPSRASAEWQQAIDKIAPYMADFKIDGNSVRMNRFFRRIMAKEGLYAWYEGKPDIQYASLIPVPAATALRVTGTSNGSIVWLCRTDLMNLGGKYGSVLTYFEKRNGRMRGSLLRPNNGYDVRDPFASGKPFYGCRAGNSLAISSLAGWYSNAPSATVESYRLIGGKWQLANQLVSEYQCDEAPRLRLSRTHHIAISPILSTTYPRHLTVCHAAALASFEEKWQLAAGKIRRISIRQRMTPLNQLDRLYGALKDGNQKLIRQLSISSQIARSVFALKPQISNGPPDTNYPSGPCTTESTLIGIDNLRVWFHFVKKNGKWVVAKLTPYKEKNQ